MARAKNAAPRDPNRADVRLDELGAQALTVAELLALVIGDAQGTAVATAASNSAAGVARLTLGQLVDVYGMTAPLARRVVASVELGRRATPTAAEGVPLRSPRDVYAVMSHLADLEHEEFHVLVLDTQHRLKRDLTITRGILNSSLVHPREVFAQAITHRAAALVLVHNHPSGDPSPSADDRAVTEQIVSGGRLLEIPVHDHVIVGRGRYTSFAEAGML